MWYGTGARCFYFASGVGMTDQEINEAVTDDKLNELVALKLGWDINPQTFIPHYSTDIKAAWEIVEFMKCEFDLMKMPSPPTWWACFKKNFGEFDGEADTAPRAICEAFLKLP